jgi:hypothetical protein
MWRSPIGVRTLRRWEWRLFRKGLKTLYYELDVSLGGLVHVSTGVPIFDTLPVASKMVMLAQVAKALRDPVEPCPARTALTEGAIAAVYGQFRRDLISEIDFSSDRFPPNAFRVRYRRLLVRAILEIHPECAIPRPSPESPHNDTERPFVPKPDCDETALWDKLLDAMLNRLVGGGPDFADEAKFSDANPEVRQYKKSRRWLEQACYSATNLKPSEEELIASHTTLWRLCRIRPCCAEDETG